MTEDQYYKIVNACDKVLLREDATLESIAIPWLHVLNEHPIFIANYADLIEDSPLPEDYAGTLHAFCEILKSGRVSVNRIARLLRNMLHTTVQTSWKNPFTNIIGLQSRDLSNLSQVDVIIVSWLINLDYLQRDDDFYFGNLQSILADRGLSSLLVLRNQTGHPTNELLGRAWRNGICSRIMLPSVISQKKKRAFARQCTKELRQLHQGEIEAKSFLERRVYHKAGDLIMKKAVKNLRLHSQIAELCRRMLPSIIITLYEGHAWERCVYHAAHTSPFPVICVGYQHTILRKHSHALKRSLGKYKGFDPDIIMTMGDVTKEILGSSEDLIGIPIITYGTHRSAYTNARIDNFSSMSTFLVLPEGIESECIFLFDFAIECARVLPEANFIFRTHPILPFERIESKLKGYHPGLGNVLVSQEQQIEEDFKRTGYVLYRGSSTVIYAIQSGLKPFYVARPDEMEIDPLYKLKEWREYVSSVEDLVVRYKSHQIRSNNSSIVEWERAREFCDKYAQPIREDSIDEIIQLANKISENDVNGVR